MFSLRQSLGWATAMPWYRVSLLILCACSGSAWADDPQHEFLLFPSVDAFTNFDNTDVATDDSFTRPEISGLYSYTGGRFRILGEYLLSSEESELERLQVGWQLTDNTRIWLGRFHTTSKFWTTEFHHGQYLQTSITRPGVEDWEDESGPIPSHITGISVDHDAGIGDKSSIGIGLSAGLAPKFIKDQLSPYDFLDPESDHGLAVNLRIAFKPDMFGGNQVGLLFGRNDINVDPGSSPLLDSLDQIDLRTAGVFADWSWGSWRALGSFVHFQNDLHYESGRIKDQFRTGYLQVEYELSEDWTVFGRSDNSFTEDDSPYLRLLPEFLAHRHMVGVRWDFHKWQALTTEIANTQAQGSDFDHAHFKELRLQWSAVLQ